MLEKLFHDFTMSWWQIGLFKLCMISFGIILGIYFPKALKKVEIIWRTLFIGIACYLVWLYFA